MKPSRPYLVALLSLVVAPVASAQDQLWIRQFGTSGHDGGGAAVPDGSGGVLVAGMTTGNLGGPSAGNSDAWLARHDSAGNRLWLRQFGTSSTDEVFAAAPDGSGGAYVLSVASGSPFGPDAANHGAWLARYDGAGNQVWLRQLGWVDTLGARALATDGAGGVYVSGYTAGSLGGPSAGDLDAWFARHDGAGNQLWIRQIGTSSPDDARAAAPDGAGGLYVSGTTLGSLGGSSAGDVDAWLARYDGAGNQVWIRQMASSGDEYPLTSAPDGARGVYIAGFVAGPGVTGHDAWLARYDGAGSALWTRRRTSSDSEHPGAAAPDGAGGVYLGGTFWGSTGGPNAGATDAWLARYDGAGSALWSRRFGTSEFDGAGGVAADRAGGVFVSGGTQGNLGGPNAGAGDAWIARHDGELGTRYCSPASPNSTGLPARLTAIGSRAALENDLTLIADGLPAGEFGDFLVGRTQGALAPPGSQGTLCLAGNIGRYNRIADLIQGPAGNIVIALTSIPVNPPTAVQPGETWNFQCWYRDHDPTLTSNFTDAVSVVFR